MCRNELPEQGNCSISTLKLTPRNKGLMAKPSTTEQLMDQQLRNEVVLDRQNSISKEITLLSAKDRTPLITIKATSWNESQPAVAISIRLSIEMLNSPTQTLLCSEAGCGNMIAKNSSWVKHFRIHQPPELKKVDDIHITYVCDAVKCVTNTVDGQLFRCFASVQGLRQHYRKYHASRQFTCGTCKKTFTMQWFLTNHEAACGISFQCKTCPKKFDSLETLRTHARRAEHQIDAGYYKDLIRTRKLKGAKDKQKEYAGTDTVPSEKEVTVPVHVSPVTESQIAKSQIIRPDSLDGIINAGNSPNLVSRPFVPILPKSQVQFSTARSNVILLHHVLGKPHQADIGTQTAPRLVRKRSASQHCQTDSKVTKTTGTITFSTSTEQVIQRKRKTSAQTQTKKLKISTQTQTPVLTKRKFTGRRQLSSTTTQTSPIKGSSMSTSHRKSQWPLQESRLMNPSLMTTLICEKSMDEVNIETQTDPNPFFGYPNSLHHPHEDVFLSEETELGEEGAKTTETQTSPRRKVSSEWSCMNGTFVTPPLSFYFPVPNGTDSNGNGRDTGNPPSPSLSTPPPVQDLDKLGIYFETMDSETQTNFNFF